MNLTLHHVVLEGMDRPFNIQFQPGTVYVLRQFPMRWRRAWLNALLGIQPVAEGVVQWPAHGFVFEAPDVCWGLLPKPTGMIQALNRTPKTKAAVKEVMWEVFPDVADAFREYEELVSRPFFHDADHLRMTELESILVDVDAWGKESRWKEWLAMVGYDEGNYDQWMQQLSPTQRGRVGLARLIGWLSEHQGPSVFLLMMEPERILTPDAMERMASYLSEFEGVVLVATAEITWLRKAGIRWRWLDCVDGQLIATER